jgi:hypothetical protein
MKVKLARAATLLVVFLSIVAGSTLTFSPKAQALVGMVVYAHKKSDREIVVRDDDGKVHIAIGSTQEVLKDPPRYVYRHSNCDLIWDRVGIPASLYRGKGKSGKWNKVGYWPAGVVASERCYK